jgi:hypothetical protein
MVAVGLSRSGPLRGMCRNRPDTDFGSGGHITQPWPKDPVDFEPNLRHGLKLVSWNMDWFADLFAEDDEGRPVLKADDMLVRGPSPMNRRGSAPTVAHRMRLLKKAIIDLDPDIILVLEGPNRSEALAHFFNLLGHGEWTCHVQQSRYARVPDGPIEEARRCIGLAVRTDTSRFSSDPLVVYDAEDPAAGLIYEATRSFFAERGSDVAPEWLQFETRPLYAEIRPQGAAAFRLLGVHIKSRGFFGGYEWSRWLMKAEANRARFTAMAHRLRHCFLDVYLADPATRSIPLVVAGGINEGPGTQVCDPRGQLTAAEIVMGSVWNADLTLGNALFEASGREYSSPDTFEDIWTMRFPDPITERVLHSAWVDHVLYSRNAPDGWCAGATIPRATLGGIPYETISDHFPVSVRIDTSIVPNT